MAELRRTHKSCLVDPLKLSQPIGAAMAVLGVEGGKPLLLGARGCASVGLVFLVRHFQRPLGIESLDLNETSLALGSGRELEAKLLELHERDPSGLSAIISTGLSEASGDDLGLILRQIQDKYASSYPEFAASPRLFIAAPDFTGSYQDGWSAAVSAIIEALVQPGPAKRPRQVNILAGQHLTPGEVDELRDILESFELSPVILPDLSGWALGERGAHDAQSGPARLEDIRGMGASVFSLALGEHMRKPGETLRRLSGVPFLVLDSLTGLGPCDAFMELLSRLSGREVPGRYKRQRSQLVEAMLQTQACFSAKKAALALDPDLLHVYCAWLTQMGTEITTALSSAEGPILKRIPVPEVLLGDLEDLEQAAQGADILIAPSSAAWLAAKHGLAHLRAGMPLYDSLGELHKVRLGYRGTRDLIFETANLLCQPGP